MPNTPHTPMGGRCLRLFLFAAFAGIAHAEPRLDIRFDAQTGDIVLSFEGGATHSHRLECSHDLLEWAPVAARSGSPQWTFVDPDSRLNSAKHYRLAEVLPPVIAPHPTWRSTITLPGDPFLSPPISGTGDQFNTTEVRWIKFALIVDDLPKVYFQDSAAYTFHFPFAADRLAPFAGMDAQEFDSVSLFRNGQQVILGAVLFAPGRNEYGIQFVGQDAYPREMLRFLFETVDAAITAPPEAAKFYMPTFEQTNTANANAQYLESHGIAVSTVERWGNANGCYSEGWALGRLVFVPGDQIASEYVAGNLLPEDILLTDGVPAEVPFVAGIITTTPTTPNSHVAILAQSFGIPFVHLSDEMRQQEAHDLAGRDVALRVFGGFLCTSQLIDASAIPETYRDEILALKTPPPLDLDPMATSGSIVENNLAGVFPADIRFIGGKAANFGFLRRQIPGNSPEAIAFTFDLWNAYLDQSVPGTGRSLRDEIAARLSAFAWPPDMPSLDVALRGIRDLIEGDADFSASQKSAILAALAGFDPARKIRFRSSTNAEDSDAFVGAGLYSSFSGCVLDDTDSDDIGPSHCDPNQPSERGVFRALRKVFASFYNLNAYLERLRHGVNESEVGMAVLVHHSFPDGIEAANGVATSQDTSRFSRFQSMQLVSQVGANSVTNPDGGSVPEIIDGFAFQNANFSVSLDHIQRSSLLLLGEDHVMGWEADYRSFAQMFFDLVEDYQDHFPDRHDAKLEFEYKKLTDGSLVVKQLREVPAPDSAAADAVGLVDAPSGFRVFQGEAGTLFGNHRLKSLFQFRSDNRWLDETGLASSFLTDATWRYAPDGAVMTRTGAPSAWPDAAFSTSESNEVITTRDAWEFPSQGGDTTYRLDMRLPRPADFGTDPIRTVGNLDLTLQANYENPVPGIGFDGNPTTVTVDQVILEVGTPDDPLPVGSIPVRRTQSTPSGKRIEINFYWPPAPTGAVAGYTAPLQRWDCTTITGLTSQPIILKGYYSQTYRPGHHNFTEEFLFEPRLEEDISPTLVQELENQNIRQIYVLLGIRNAPVQVVDASGNVRELN